MQVNHLSFSQFHQRLITLYRNKNIDAGLEWLDFHAAQYPEQAANLMIWRVCLLALSGQMEAAFNVLEQGLEQGFWWSPDSLRGEADLANLQENQKFKKIITVCSKRMDAARNLSRPTCELHLPDRTAFQPPFPLLMVLHGRSGRTDQFAEHWCAALKAGWAVAVIGSSQVLGYQSYGWDDRQLAFQEICMHWQTLSSDPCLTLTPSIIGGFSQGGGLAFDLAVSRRLPVTGFAAVSPALVDLDNPNNSYDLQDLHGLVFSGELDARWSALSLQMGDWLNRHGALAECVVFPGLAHDFPDDFSARFLAWLARIIPPASM